MSESLEQSRISLPMGRWAAAVSGGADSVAMLLLCRERVAHVVTMDHETRRGASGEDAAFVQGLAEQLGLPCTMAKISEVGDFERTSAGFRDARLRLYCRVVEENGLEGVLVAHHADDQAETVMMRLLRGASFEGLGGMAADALVEGVRIVRPLINIRKQQLIAFLHKRGQAWREDVSNTSEEYARNRVRGVLARDEALTEVMLELGQTAAAFKAGLDSVAKESNEEIRVGEWAGLPGPIAMHAARRYLAQAVPARELTPATVKRFLAWTGDASWPARIELPGKVVGHRSRSVIRIIPHA